MIDDDGWIPRRVLDLLNLVVIVAVVVFVLVLTGFVIYATGKIAQFAQQQIEVVQHQNNTQLCAQRDIIAATRQIGRKLGLDVSDIALPDVGGFHCPPGA